MLQYHKGYLMFNLWKTMKCLVLDPLGVRDIVHHMNAKTATLQGDIFHSTKRTEELTKLFHSFESRMEEHLFIKQVNDALDASVPDMFWVKDIHGRYLMANKAIRDNLLFDDEPFGKTDRELASAEIARVGEENHNFGGICANSDIIVLQNEQAMKFNEDGTIKGKYVMLQVHKNVVRDSKGNIVGTVGVGRDITYEVTELREIAEETECISTRDKINALIAYYRFEDRT